MAAEAGRNFLLKLKSGTNLTTVAAMLETSFEVNGEMVDITNKDSAGKRTLLAGGGKSSLSITASGILTDVAHSTTLMGYAEDRTINDFQLNFDTDLTVTASCQVTKFGASGAEGDASKYSITLESSGDWSMA
jgi:TP901-1 family phage major tail protein